MTKYVPGPQVLAAHLRGETVLLHIGEKRYFQLNESASCVWKALEAGTDIDGIVRRLEVTFNVTSEVAKESVEAVLAELATGHLVTILEE